MNRTWRHAVADARMAAGLTVAVLVGALVALTPGTASAHYVYEAGIVAEYGNDRCVRNRSEVSHGGGGGFAKVDTVSLTDMLYVGASCVEPWFRPAGYLRSRFQFLKWNGSTWALCSHTPNWTLSTDSRSKLVIKHNYGKNTPCGNGYYGTMGHAAAKNSNGWHGGWLWSGQHLLPA